MRTLFLRIFLWFWLAMAAVAAVLVVSSPLFTRSRPNVERWQRSTEDVLKGRSQYIKDLVAREGVEVLREDVSHHRGGDRPRGLFLFDLKGQEVLGNQPPPEVLDIARQAIESGQMEIERAGSSHVAASLIKDPKGQTLVLAITLRRSPSPLDLLEPKVLAPRLLALVLVAGALCFWLARYLTSPIAALREATRRLASGDLSARVGKSIRRRRDEISDLARDFDAMADRVVILLASQQRLVRDISHELRSPLARLRVALELARTGPEEKTRRALDRIEEEADKLSEMIHQVLTLSRLEAGGGNSAEQIRFDLATLTTEVVDDVSFEAEALGCSIRFDSAGSCQLVGSPELVRSALENVLRNAAHYAPKDSGVEVSLTINETKKAVVRIRDHGPGVPEEHLRKVFEPFFRVDDARDRTTGGTGLGLAIAARAVALHKGSIEAANAPEGGLLVEISLPLAEDSPPPPLVAP